MLDYCKNDYKTETKLQFENYFEIIQFKNQK